MKSGLILIGSNQYGVASEFINGIREDLHSLNISTELLDLNSQGSIESHINNDKTINDFDFFLSFNAVGLDLSIKGEKLSKAIDGKPCFVFLVDHPLHLITRFIGLKVILLCVDQEHVGFARLCGMQAYFFPHAVPAAMVAKPTDILSMESKEGILFPASYFNTAHWRQKLQPVWHQIGHLLENSNSVTRFLQYLEVLPSGEKPASVQLDNNIQLLATCADFYIRGRQRENVLSICEKFGLQITVVGNNSNEYRTRFPSHKYLDAVPFKDLRELIKKARFVLHNSPGFELGLHERIVYSMALGTPVICDFLARPDRIFGADYRLLTINDVSNIDSSHYHDIQKNNLSIISQRHTWQRQLKTLMNEYQLQP